MGGWLLPTTAPSSTWSFLRSSGCIIAEGGREKVGSQWENLGEYRRYQVWTYNVGSARVSGWACSLDLFLFEWYVMALFVGHELVNFDG
jgi:hypothetical protein